MEIPVRHLNALADHPRPRFCRDWGQRTGTGREAIYSSFATRVRDGIRHCSITGYCRMRLQSILSSEFSDLEARSPLSASSLFYADTNSGRLVSPILISDLCDNGSSCCPTLAITFTTLRAHCASSPPCSTKYQPLQQEHYEEDLVEKPYHREKWGPLLGCSIPVLLLIATPALIYFIFRGEGRSCVQPGLSETNISSRMEKPR